VMPQVHPDAPCVGLAEIAPLCLLAGIFLGALARFFGRHAPAPTGDPLFEASKNYHL